MSKIIKTDKVIFAKATRTEAEILAVEMRAPQVRIVPVHLIRNFGEIADKPICYIVEEVK